MATHVRVLLEAMMDAVVVTEGTRPSKIEEKRQHSRISTAPIAATSSASGGRRSLTAGGETATFMVPKLSPRHASMFGKLETKQFDRGLYDVRQDSTASSDEPITGQCGSVKMWLSFDQNLSLLTVRLLESIDLIALRTDGPPNPYCRVTLGKPEPNGHPQCQQSKTYHKNRSPEMNDEFFFDVPTGQLQNCRLEILIYDYDPCSVDECIGYCWLNLGKLDIPLAGDPTISFWAEVLPIPHEQDDGCGELLFSLTYLSKAQRLTVNIFKARNLIDEMESAPSASVRCTVISGEKRLKRKKTACRKATSHPVYNEALTFNIPKNSLCDIVLYFEVVHESGTFGMASKVLGRLDLPLHKCKDLWRAIIRSENTQARWYALERPDKSP